MAYQYGNFGNKSGRIKMIDIECSPGSFGQRDGILGNKNGRLQIIGNANVVHSSSLIYLFLPVGIEERNPVGVK